VTFTPARMLPDVDDVVRGILAASGVTVGANVPADLLDRLPYISAKRIGGASVDPVNLDRALVQVDCWSGARRTAVEMAETCRALLWRAWRTQTVYAVATVAHFAESTAPFELRTAGQADGLYRMTATYSLHIRPTTRLIP
jgi:hypothetical protein